MDTAWIDVTAAPVVTIQVPVGGVAVVLVPRRLPQGPVAKAQACLVTPRQGDLAAALTRTPPEAWLAEGQIVPGDVGAARLVAPAGVLHEALAWLSRTGLPLGKAVALATPDEPVYLRVADGQMRMAQDSRATVVPPAGAASAAAAPVAGRAGLAPRPSGAKLRVLVVDDSRVMRRLLCEIFGRDPQLEVIGDVGEPEKVAQAVAALRPDVVTLDIHMGAMSGVDVVRQIFPMFHVPIVMISALSRDDGPEVVDALLAGAVDYLQKPSHRELDTVAPQMCAKVRDAGRSRITRSANIVPVRHAMADGQPVDTRYLIGIGSSTGGLEALRQVLTAFPAEIPPVLIVQHIPAAFSRAFAERMDACCACTVQEAKDGEAVRPGHAYIAPGGLQMGVVQSGAGLKIAVVDAPPVLQHKPSVDYLFDAIASLRLPRVAAAVLTGMGTDGARGMLKLRQGGARTLAQDEATSVVYGMPKEAAKLGGAERIVPLQDVAHTLLSFTRRPR